MHAKLKTIFDEHTVNIKRKGISIPKGGRCHQTRLWRLLLHNQWKIKQNLHIETNKKENYVGQNTNSPDLIKFLQTAALRPFQLTWI